MVLVVLVATLLWCGWAYFRYGRALERWMGLRGDEVTPAHRLRDGVDYVATGPWVLFGHHFSSIAGAGPIVGPILAGSLFGWGPTWAWILLGAVFVGGAHDFGAMVMSLRTRGCSVIETCRERVGRPTALLFIGFTVVALLYVIVVFLDLTAASFVERPAVATASGWFVVVALGLGLVQRWRERGGGMGWLGRHWWVVLVGFIVLTYLGLAVGAWFPAGGWGKAAWVVPILGYCGLAAMLPVNWLMQPRDFLSATFLYALILLGVGGVLLAGVLPGAAPELKLPSFMGFRAENGAMLMPFLFITVACGACSGFHSMVASGTTSKQLDRASEARPVAYGGMLVEAVLATFALLCLGVLGGMVPGGPSATFAEGAARFFAVLGVPVAWGVTFAMLAISTFLLTTLDTCTRLCRFLLEELTGWRGTVVSRLVMTLAVLAVAGWVASQSFPGPGGTLLPAWRAVWPLFGATNQLLGAMALVTLLVFQRSEGRPWGFVVVPAGLMAVMPLWALAELAWAPSGSGLLRGMAAGLLILGLAVVGLTLRSVGRGSSVRDGVEG